MLITRTSFSDKTASLTFVSRTIKPIRCLFSVLFLCLAGTTFSIAAEKSISLPFTTNPDGLVILPAHFGSIAGHVFLDTGAGMDVLAPSIVRQLGGKSAGHLTGFRMGGERLDLDLYTIPQLTVGPLVKKNAVVATWDVLDSPDFKRSGVQGIISLNDFRHQSVTFDFRHKTIVFETAKSRLARRKLGISVPLEFDDQRGIALDSFAQFLIGSQPGECEIDMGSPSSTISTRYLQILGISPEGPGVSKHVSRNLAGATDVRYDTTISQIVLAGAQVIRLQHPQVSFSDIIYDCVIGLDFWAGKAVTFDVAHRELIVSAK